VRGDLVRAEADAELARAEAFSEEALAAARAAGIELDPPERGPGYTLAALGTPPAPGDNTDTLALAALIERADTDTIAAASDDLARTARQGNDSRLLAAADRLRDAIQRRE
jgi:hypothetical protein